MEVSEQVRARIVCRKAATRGAEEGRAAGAEWANAVLMSAVGPEDYPRADLSGEWAGALTGPALFEWAAGVPEDAERIADAYGDVCQAYEDAYAEAVQAEADAAGIVIPEAE